MSQCQKSSPTHDQALPTVTHRRLQPRYILAMQLPLTVTCLLSPCKLPKWQTHAWSLLKSPRGLPEPHRSASHRLALGQLATLSATCPPAMLPSSGALRVSTSDDNPKGHCCPSAQFSGSHPPC